MRKSFQLLASLYLSCGRIPFLAAVVLAISTRLGGISMPGHPLVREQPRSAVGAVDASLIDDILSKSAPELGLTLRRQIEIAIAEESGAAGYDPLLILAVIKVESEFNDGAVSPKGARGLMQIRRGTLAFLAERESLRLTPEEIAADPALRVRLGIRYLRALQERFGQLDLALLAYNVGPTRLVRAIQEGELDGLRRYAKLVRRVFRRFREGEGLEGDWALAERDSVRAAVH